MAYGKKKARGPIAKAFKYNLDLGKTYETIGKNYIDGVESHADRWVTNTTAFLRYFKPKVDDEVERLQNTQKDPYARMRTILKRESAIATEYVKMRNREIKQRGKNAFAAAGNSTAMNFGVGTPFGGPVSKTRKITL
ncbi:MAG: hypothetical protein OWT28_10400 [Firmicutes bacterium]|nr:hypothetical protein [Bacillota bacterium]